MALKRNSKVSTPRRWLLGACLCELNQRHRRSRKFIEGHFRQTFSLQYSRSKGSDRKISNLSGLPLERVFSFGRNQSGSSRSWYSVSSTKDSGKLWLRFRSRWSRAQSGQNWASRCFELPRNNSSNPPSKKRSCYAGAMSWEQQLECF